MVWEWRENNREKGLESLRRGEEILSKVVDR